MPSTIASTGKHTVSQQQQGSSPRAGEKQIVYIDADGVLFNTPEFALKKIFRSAGSESTAKPFIDAIANMSFFALETIPFVSRFSNIIKNESVQANEELFELAKKLKDSGIEVKILTANGETGFIRELVEKKQLDIEVIKCSKREKAKKGGVLIDDSAVTYILTKLYNPISANQTSQILFSGMHNNLIADFVKKLGGRVAKNSAEITECLANLGVLKTELRKQADAKPIR